jgi:hypothetical protein
MEEESSRLVGIVCPPPPLGVTLYKGERADLPLHQGNQGGRRPRDGGASSRVPQTLTLVCPGRMGPLGPMKVGLVGHLVGSPLGGAQLR